MKNLKDVYKDLLSAFNYPKITEELLNDIKGPILLHISDTPVEIYHDIFRIIDIIKPQYIIHTGDMADDVKLEIQKNRIDRYHRGVKQLVEGLEKNDTRVYYVMGNHDDYNIVSQLTRKGIILEEGLLTIDSRIIAVGHYYKEYPIKIDFNLYGHSFEPKSFEKDGTIGLNGVLNINIIDLSNKRVFHLRYPKGTNRLRGMESKKIGL